MLTSDLSETGERPPKPSSSWASGDPPREADAGTNLLELGPYREFRRAAGADASLPRQDGLSQALLDTFVSEVAVLDRHGQVTIANTAWRAKAEKAVVTSGRVGKRDAIDFLSNDDDTRSLIARKVSEILSGLVQEAKVNFTVREGSHRRYYRLRAVALGSGKSCGAVVVNDDVTETYALHRDKRLLTEQLMRSEETERRRIAREMHDSTVQDLVAIGLNLRRLRHLANDPVAQEVLGEVRMILTRTQQDVRTLSYLLHPPLLEEGGLVLALASLIRGLSSRMQMRVEFETDISDSRLPIDVEMALYRVAQEALINVHKHACATHAIVRYHRECDWLVLRVEDDGVGFGGRKDHIGSGVGIQGMRARLTQLGGALTLSTLKRGTRLKAVIPVDETMTVRP